MWNEPLIWKIPEEILRIGWPGNKPEPLHKTFETPYTILCKFRWKKY